MLGQVDKQNVSKCDTAEKATFHKKHWYVCKN